MVKRDQQALVKGSGMNGGRKSRGFWRIALILLVVAGGSYALWRFTDGESEATYNIQTVELSRGSIERSISATGSVEALVTVDVSSQLSGQMSEVTVDFNSPVTKGATLSVIDPRTFAARVASAEANLAIARTTVALQEANIIKMQALLDQAQRALERQKTLAANNATPAAMLEAAETALATAKADLHVAHAQLDNARATITAREADVSQAKLDHDRTQIRSPIDGVVIARNIDPGGTVAASLQAPVLFQIAQDLTQIQILVLVDEADIGSIQTGQSVTFTVDAFPDRIFSGEVAQVRIAGTTTNNVVTYTVVVRAQNPGQKLLPGMTATVRIITGSRSDVLRIPNEAVRFTPPKDLKTVTAAERPNRDEAVIASLAERLKMTPEQIEKFRSGMAATARTTRPEGASPRAERQGGEDELSGEPQPRRTRTAGGSGNAQQRRGRLTRVLEGILTPEQMAEFKAAREEWRDNTRPANIWVQTPDGLQPHRLQLGLADENFSEVVRGGLKEGDKVVTRARRDGAGNGEGNSNGAGQRRRRSS